jgi:hypothetical protein
LIAGTRSRRWLANLPLASTQGALPVFSRVVVSRCPRRRGAAARAIVELLRRAVDRDLARGAIGVSQ